MVDSHPIASPTAAQRCQHRDPIAAVLRGEQRADALLQHLQAACPHPDELHAVVAATVDPDERRALLRKLQKRLEGAQ